jgi:hypothetical protein
LDDQTILAVLENFGTVSVCPGGIVHVNLAHCSLKFIPSDFEKFCQLVEQAHRKFDLPRRVSGRPTLQVVTAEPREEVVENEDK